jgi:hypothetical protein
MKYIIYYFESIFKYQINKVVKGFKTRHCSASRPNSISFITYYYKIKNGLLRLQVVVKCQISRTSEMVGQVLVTIENAGVELVTVQLQKSVNEDEGFKIQ